MNNNEITFPTPEEVNNLVEKSKKLVNEYNSQDLLNQYASNCSNQIHRFCANAALNKTLHSLHLFSYLPNPSNCNIKTEKPSLNIPTLISEHISANHQKSTLLTTTPVISLRTDWNSTNFLSGSYNHAFHFTINSFESTKQRYSIPIAPPDKTNSFCRCACFHPSDVLIGVSKDTSIYLYDISSLLQQDEMVLNRCPFLLSTLPNLHKYPITGLTFSPNGSHFITSSLDSTIKTVDLMRSKTVYDITLKNQITSLDSSPNGQFVGATTSNGDLIIFDDRQEGNLFRIAAHKSWASTLTFSQYGSIVATGGSDKSINLFDLRQPSEPAQLFRLHRPYGTPHSISFDSSNRLWCGTSFGELYAFQLDNAQNIFSMNINAHKTFTNNEIDDFSPIYSVLYVKSNESIMYSTGNNEISLINLNEELFETFKSGTFTETCSC